jgi:hypothetical protein
MVCDGEVGCCGSVSAMAFLSIHVGENNIVQIDTRQCNKAVGLK